MGLANSATFVSYSALLHCSENLPILLPSFTYSIYALYYVGKMLYSFLLLIFTFISTTSCSVEVKYLKGVPRLNNPNYTDYYFCCNIVGTALLWEVNESKLGEYTSGNISEVLFGQISNFNYTATLLSSTPKTNGQFTFDSVLIVSLLGSSNLDVTCWNGLVARSSTRNIDNGFGVENMYYNSSVAEDYVLTDNIVKADNVSQTSIFVCGVQNSLMYWRTSAGTIAFGSFDGIGEHRQILEQRAVTVKQQAIVIAHEPYQIVSVLFVTDTSEVTVTCGYSRNEVELTSRPISLTTPSEDTTVPETSSSTTSSKCVLLGSSNDTKLSDGLDI